MAPKDIPQQILGLKETLRQAKEFAPYLASMIAAWKVGDEAEMSKIFLDSMKELPEMYQRIMVDRNQDWVKKMDNWAAEQGTWFTVVGSAHLVGPDALPAMLSKAGFRVTRI